MIRLVLLLPFLALLFAHTGSAFVVVRPTSNIRSSLLRVATEPAPLFVDETKKTQQSVQDYYGVQLQSSDDLKTNACTTGKGMPPHMTSLLKNIHPDVLSKYYGCGLCLPSYDLTGASVLDLGCGAGRDVYLASQLVGATGTVVGVDMTQAQLETAKTHQAYHAEEFGYANTEFVLGTLEELGSLEPLQGQQFDVVISNCVLNLCQDKGAVLKACYDLLKPGGELYFSDVYASRRVPKTLQEDALLWGECLSGALYWNDFENLAKQSGFRDPRLVEDSPITIQNQTVADLMSSTGSEGLEFYSATYRLLKLDSLEPACEDYGQAVVYKGTMPRQSTYYTLDKHHVFEVGRLHPVCGNTWNMLADCPRHAEHFDFVGNFDRHYGIFEGCGTSIPYDAVSAALAPASGGGGGSCC